MMRDYSYSELMAMQEEATRRVHEMQQRARETAERAQREISAVSPENFDYSSQGSEDDSQGSVVNTTENGVTVTPKPREVIKINTAESPANIPRTETSSNDAPAAKQIYPKPHPPRHIPMPSGISQESDVPLNSDDDSVQKKYEQNSSREHANRGNIKNNDKRDTAETNNNENGKCFACKENCPFRNLYNGPLRSLLNNGETADQSLLLALLLLIGSDSGDELMMLALLYIMG